MMLDFKRWLFHGNQWELAPTIQSLCSARKTWTSPGTPVVCDSDDSGFGIERAVGLYRFKFLSSM